MIETQRKKRAGENRVFLHDIHVSFAHSQPPRLVRFVSAHVHFRLLL